MSPQPDSIDVAPTNGPGARLEVEVERLVAGGLGLAHDTDGRVVLVEGGLPGDRLAVEVVAAKKHLLSARLREVLRASSDRVEPRCPEVALGCGGCDLQHAAPDSQSRLKVMIVTDALRRIAKLVDVEVRTGPRLAAFGYRTSLRCSVDGNSGRLGFRRARTHETHVVEDCLTAHPFAAEIVRSASFPAAFEVVVRVSRATGERLVVVNGSSDGAVVPDGVRVSRAGRTVDLAGNEAVIHEEVCGHRFRISAGSFFQARPDGAEALVAAVRRALSAFDPTRDVLADLYGGVGLFALGLGATRGVLVESSIPASADAQVNLAGRGLRVLRSKVENWKPRPADAVVADPTRRGLEKAGVAAVAATGATQVALVSCDPAAMARDVSLLGAAGYRLEWVEVVDMFPQTHHVETVAALTREQR